MAVLGGGLVGCETALHLALDGKYVTVIEMMDRVCPDANQRYRPLLMAQLEKHVTCVTGMCGQKITGQGIICMDKDGNEVIFDANTVICAVGQKPLRSVAENLQNCAPEVIEIGDCVKAANVTEAVFRGYWAGVEIE